MMASDITTWKRPFSNAFLSIAGDPEGLRKEDTQILVSITALTATLTFSDFPYGLGDV